MAGETTLTIVGNLTADPELRSTNTGAQVINRLLTYPKDARRAVLYDNLHDSLATFEESAPDYPDPDDDADETDGGEAVDPNTGEIK